MQLHLIQIQSLKFGPKQFLNVVKSFNYTLYFLFYNSKHAFSIHEKSIQNKKKRGVFLLQFIQGIYSYNDIFYPNYKISIFLSLSKIPVAPFNFKGILKKISISKPKLNEIIHKYDDIHFNCPNSSMPMLIYFSN